MNIQPLHRATYSKKNTWHNRVDPMFVIKEQLAKTIRDEIDKSVIEQLHGLRTVKDGIKR